MKTKPKINLKTKQQLLLEIKQLQTRLDATERRLQEANEILQAQIAERKRGEQTFEKARKYTDGIMQTIREPLLVLASDLRVLSANRSFYDTFKVTLKETTGNLIYNLGNRQWDISRLRTLLEDILKKNKKFDNYEVEHVFSNIGHKIMLLNARRIIQKEIGSQMILLAIEDITERREIENGLEENLLEIAGFEVFEAENASSGIAVARKEKPDIIIMDVRLPDMRGTEAAKILRQDKETRDIPIVFVTASVMAEGREDIKDITNTGFIGKPINTRTFAEEISQFMK
jgi:CheY-like chemotaxis protein